MVYMIAMGANLPSPEGGPRETLEAAVTALAGNGISLLPRSRWYRSAAFPPGSGPDFVNGAVAVTSLLGPEQMLAVLHRIERDLGRSRARRWEPRVCDLDLIACDNLVLPDWAMVAHWMQLPPAEQRVVAPPELILPHPRLHERAFVLAPLVEIAPDWVHPLLDLTARELFAALPEETRREVEPL